MRWFRLLLAAVASLVALGAACLATEHIEIPLEHIWAYRMPNAEKISNLDLSRLPQKFGTLSTGPLDLRKHPDESPAPPGFVVRGTGLEALIEAHRLLPPGQAPPSAFRAGEPLSIVFSSRTFFHYVHLDRVTRKDTVFTVEYRFVPHETRERLTPHLALIPTGPLQPGEYRVEMKGLPLDPSWAAAGFTPVSPQVARSVVCSSFCFQVVP
ncbi:MAG: hypothetical protein ACRCT8_11640 [Lacipirellulaceae bacterium]